MERELAELTREIERLRLSIERLNETIVGLAETASEQLELDREVQGTLDDVLDDDNGKER